MLYTTFNTLNNDVLLNIFNYYRLVDEKHWNVRLEWFKLAHVCRRWRFLVYGSAFHLDMSLRCKNGSPVVDMLAILPPLPLVIDYRYATATIQVDALDELGIFHVLQLRDRVRHVDLHIPHSSLHKSLALMNEPFPNLEHVTLSSTGDGDSSLILPKNFLAPNLRHLRLSKVGLPGDLTLLSTASLLTLTLTNVQASGYILPKHLVMLLQSSPQLEELSIGFSIPLPSPGAERGLLDVLVPPVTLLNLNHLTFRGVSAYLESLVAQMRAPRLQALDITFFNQLAFVLPHLSRFTDAVQELKLPIAKISFDRDSVSVGTADDWGRDGGSRHLSLRVICKPFDWQIDCAAQICSALIPVLSSVEQLIFDTDAERRTIWPNGAVDGVTWLELLRPFIGGRGLYIHGSVLAWELSRALHLDEPDIQGLDPNLLLALSWLVHETHIEHTFAPFNGTRQNAALRLPRLSQPPSPVHLDPSPPSPMLLSPVPVYPLVHPSPSPVQVSPLSASSSPLPVYTFPSPVPVLSESFPMQPHISTNRWKYPSSSISDLLQFLDLEFVPFSLVSLRSEPVPKYLRGPRPRLAVPYNPPFQINQDFPPSRTARSVREFPPPKHIRCRVRPSHKGAGSAWR